MSPARATPTSPICYSLLLILGHLLTIWALWVWVVKHYPEACESHVHWQPDRPRLPRPSHRPRGSDPLTASNNRFRNVMRARGRVVLISAANRLWVHAVLTVRTNVTAEGLLAEWKIAVRRLNRITGAGPYLAIPHLHSGSRAHIHLLLPGRIPYQLLRRAWRAGAIRVYARHSGRHTHRETARILARYATRSWVVVGDAWPLNARRYYAPRRFSPRLERLAAPSLGDARRIVTRAMGAPPAELSKWSLFSIPAGHLADADLFADRSGGAANS